MRINPKNSLTLIGVFYNYFLTDNTDLHAVEESEASLNLLTQFFWHHVAEILLKLFFQIPQE